MPEDVWDDTPEGAPTHYRPKPPPPPRAPQPKTEAGRLRSSQAYKQLRAQFRLACSRTRNPDGTYGLPCWLCAKPIDYRLKYPHPDSWSLDHATPINQAPQLALTITNFRASCLTCNLSRGDGTREAAPTTTGRIWDDSPVDRNTSGIDPDLDIGIPSEHW